MVEHVLGSAVYISSRRHDALDLLPQLYAFMLVPIMLCVKIEFLLPMSTCWYLLCVSSRRHESMVCSAIKSQGSQALLDCTSRAFINEPKNFSFLSHQEFTHSMCNNALR